jgi:hypothetical protein
VGNNGRILDLGGERSQAKWNEAQRDILEGDLARAGQGFFREIVANDNLGTMLRANEAHDER